VLPDVLESGGERDESMSRPAAIAVLVAAAGCSQAPGDQPAPTETYGALEVQLALPDLAKWLRGDEQWMCWRTSAAVDATGCMATGAATPKYLRDWLVPEPIQLIDGRMYWSIFGGGGEPNHFVDSGTLSETDRVRHISAPPPIQSFAATRPGIYVAHAGVLYYWRRGVAATKVEDLQRLDVPDSAVRFVTATETDAFVIGSKVWRIHSAGDPVGKPVIAGFSGVDVAAGGIVSGEGFAVFADGFGSVQTHQLVDDAMTFSGVEKLPGVSGRVVMTVHGGRVFVSGTNAAMTQAVLYSCRLSDLGDCQDIGHATQSTARGPAGAIATPSAVFWAAERTIYRIPRAVKR
jgi:hypothetical protein